MPTPNPVTKCVTNAAKKLGLKWERTYNHQLKDGTWRCKLFGCTKLAKNVRAEERLQEEIWRQGDSLYVLSFDYAIGWGGEFSYNICVAEELK